MTFFFFPPPFLCRVTQRRSPLKRTPPIFTGGDNWGEPNVSIFWVEVFFFPSLSLSLSLSLSVSLSPLPPSFPFLPPSPPLSLLFSFPHSPLSSSISSVFEWNQLCRASTRSKRKQATVCVCFFLSPLSPPRTSVCCVVLCCVLVC